MVKDDLTQARDAVGALLVRHGEQRARIERVSRVGVGLSRSGVVVSISGASSIPGHVVALIPDRKGGQKTHGAREREAGVLRLLDQSCPDFDFPRLIGIEWANELPILMVEMVTGLSLGPRGVIRDPIRYLRTVARAAGAVHSLPRDPFYKALGGPTTCREFALDRLTRFSDHDDRDIKRAFEWCCERLPDDAPTVVLHGDLLGQNLLVHPDDERRVGVIDWSDCCLGDPAFEFAVVTRGVRNPFKVSHGRERLLEWYEESSGRSISMERVLFYETVLVMGWLVHYLEREPLSGDVREERRRLATVMRGFAG